MYRVLRIFHEIVCSIQFCSKMWLMVAWRLNGIIIHIKRWYHIKVETYKSWFSSKNTATGSILIYLHSLSANTAIWSHNVKHNKKISFLSTVHIDYKLGHWFFVWGYKITLFAAWRFYWNLKIAQNFNYKVCPQARNASNILAGDLVRCKADLYVIKKYN